MSSTTIGAVTTVSAPLNQALGSTGAGIPVNIGGDATVSGALAVAGALTVTGAINGGAVAAVGPLSLQSYLKAAKPAATAVGQLIYVSDATGAHVTGSLCFSNAASGTANWIDVTTGIAVV